VACAISPCSPTAPTRSGPAGPRRYHRVAHRRRARQPDRKPGRAAGGGAARRDAAPAVRERGRGRSGAVRASRRWKRPRSRCAGWIRRRDRARGDRFEAGAPSPARAFASTGSTCSSPSSTPATPASTRSGSESSSADPLVRVCAFAHL
jgi:hypothetical protein